MSGDSLARANTPGAGDLRAAFTDVGLQLGDTVLVHSALRRLGPVDGGADAVIDALLATVGTEGTVAVPTHTWAVVNERQPVFHQTLTPSNVGALTNVFRKRRDAVRSLHPTHSIAAIGPRAVDLTIGHEADETPCARDGAYGRLAACGAKVLIIGVGLECCTFFHGCEEWAGMPWAYRKRPVQLYSIPESGGPIPVTMHQHFVHTWDFYPRLEPLLVDAGCLRVARFGGCELRLLDAGAGAAWLVERLRDDPSIILPDPMPVDE